MIPPYWPDGPLPIDPGRLQVIEVTTFRLVAYRGDRHRHVCEVAEAGVDAALATWRAAMPGWRLEAQPRTGRRWLSENGEMWTD